MVDVREIYARVSESPTISEIAYRFMSLNSAQAVTVRILPWLLFDSDEYHNLRHFPFPWDGRDYSRFPPFFYDRWLAPEDHFADFSTGRHDTTMTEIDRRFRDYPPFPGNELGPGYPFQVTLHANASKLEQSDEIEEIREMTRNERVFVTAERRPPMKLQFAAGDNVFSGGMRGTLGGFVTDRTNVYGVTCAHVAKLPTVTDLGGASIGSTSAVSIRLPMAQGMVCTPFPGKGAVGAGVNSEDFALINMTVGVLPSGLSAKPSPTLNQGDLIDVVTGGHSRRFQVRSLCIAMALADSGNSYCFAPLVELYSSSGTTIAGDSGVWGIKNRSDWATTIVGADSISSFAFDARDVATWIDMTGAMPAGSWSVY